MAMKIYLHKTLRFNKLYVTALFILFYVNAIGTECFFEPTMQGVKFVGNNLDIDGNYNQTEQNISIFKCKCGPIANQMENLISNFNQRESIIIDEFANLNRKKVELENKISNFQKQIITSNQEVENKILQLEKEVKKMNQQISTKLEKLKKDVIEMIEKLIASKEKLGYELYLDIYKDGYSVGRYGENYVLVDRDFNIYENVKGPNKPVYFEFVSSFSEGFAFIITNGKYAYINKERRIVSDSYDFASDFTEGKAIVGKKQSKTEKKGWRVFRRRKTEDSIDTMYCFIDNSFETIGDGYKFTEAKSYSNGFARVKIEYEDWNYIDSNGELLFRKSNFSSLENFSKNGQAVAKKANGNVGVIDKTGGNIIKFKYIEIQPESSGYYLIKDKKRYYRYINKQGESLKEDGLTLKFAYATPFVDSTTACVKFLGDDHYTFINIRGKSYGGSIEGCESNSDYFNVFKDGNTCPYHKGETIIPCMWQKVSEIKDNMLMVSPSSSFTNVAYYKIVRINTKKKGKILVDDNGEIKYFLFGRDFSDGLAAVTNDDHLWGFINKKGDLVIKYNYDDIKQDFEKGKAIVKKDNQCITINKRGETIKSIECQ